MFDRQDDRIESFEQGMQRIRWEQRAALCGEFSWIQVVGLLDGKKAGVAIADVRRTGASRSAVWARIRREADHYSKVVARRVKEHQKFEIPCWKEGVGCNLCCHRVVQVKSKIESWAIHRATSRLPKEKLDLFNDQRAEMMDVLRQAYQIHGWLAAAEPPQEEYDVVERRFEELGGFCPYLDLGGGCMIYEDRPVACRLMMVVGDKCQLGQRRNGVFPADVMSFLNQLCAATGSEKGNVLSGMRQV